jgi:hypothetical protein
MRKQQAQIAQRLGVGNARRLMPHEPEMDDRRRRPLERHIEQIDDISFWLIPVLVEQGVPKTFLGHRADGGTDIADVGSHHVLDQRMARPVAEQFEIGLVDTELHADIGARIHDVDGRDGACARIKKFAALLDGGGPKRRVERGVVDLADVMRKATRLDHGRSSCGMSSYPIRRYAAIIQSGKRTCV